MKFSIIVPVYNVGPYIERCLESLKKQSCSSFEVLIINDGSTDDSLEKIERAVRGDSRFFIYTKKNGGISDARNYGIKKARGEYLLFVDGDDFVHDTYLQVLENITKQYPKADMIRFQTFRYDEISRKDSICSGDNFDSRSGIQAFPLLIKNVYFDVVWLYLYRREFFLKNQFQFTKGRYHEDFGLLPYIIVKAKEIIAIPDPLYYYVLRKNSITTSKDEKKMKKRVEDAWYFYHDLQQKFAKEDFSDSEKSFLYSYLANTIIGMGKQLDGKSKDEFIQKLKEEDVFQFLLRNSLRRKIKWFLSKYFTGIYLRYFVK